MIWRILKLLLTNANKNDSRKAEADMNF